MAPDPNTQGLFAVRGRHGLRTYAVAGLKCPYSSFNPKPNGLGVSGDARAAGPAIKRGHNEPAAYVPEIGIPAAYICEKSEQKQGRL
jgi:hypothetical protein